MPDTIILPISWILGIIATLGTVIATLAGIIWSILNSRLAAQDKIIEHLRGEVDRLVKGCGVSGCSWRGR